MNVAQTRIDTNTSLIMLNQSQLVTESLPTDASALLVIKTRFGEITVDISKAVTFPRGLLGMPDKTRYALANFPGSKMAQFKLLQSLNDHNLSFITLPLDMENSIIAAQDLRTAASDLQIKEGGLATLLIVSVHRSPEQVKLSVNARAPIFIDAERRIGVQHVFQNDSYKVQHMLG